jgi:predicted GIY-YIG superfamily endonuclease
LRASAGCAAIQRLGAEYAAGLLRRSLLAMTADGTELVMKKKHPAVYIMANRRQGTLYTGVTSDLIQRVYQHKKGQVKGFTARYRCDRLVYFEMLDDMTNAILREKQIKAGSRAAKVALIEGVNPEWRDLYDDLM